MRSRGFDTHARMDGVNSRAFTRIALERILPGISWKRSAAKTVDPEQRSALRLFQDAGTLMDFSVLALRLPRCCKNGSRYAGLLTLSPLPGSQRSAAKDWHGAQGLFTRWGWRYDVLEAISTTKWSN